MTNTVDVVAALVWDAGRFLICQRPPQKARGLLWEFPGGKVEKGETREQALKREMKEELDADIRVKGLFCALTHVYPDLSVNLFVYEAELTCDRLRMLEHNAINWIKPAEIEQYTFCPADEGVLNIIKQRSA
ncbi:MAG: (deoxy)nucleoside triphosphate pyrophosphohydrolase [Clostridiales bacterium]|nr:(deoxy)nucleoside triphosphate pyrophosphohydrolase [Clostridiales bacterium]